jgi:hypothetical protein
MRLAFSFGLVLVLAASSLLAEDQEEGFVALFDGKNLDAWQGDVKGYVIEEGVLVCKGGKLSTKYEFADFILRFEFKLPAGGNNGIGLRTPLDGDPAFAGMESQILDDTSRQYANLKPWQFHGSIYGVVPAKTGHLKPVGEWNAEEIVCNGTKVKVTLNGTVIVDADLAEFADKPTPDGQKHPGLKRTTGHIALLGHGSPVAFRNIRVKQLK